MKTLNIYKNTTLALMALTMGLSLVGCAEDSELIYQGAQQLSVKPLILDNKVSRATTASEASLNEDKLYKFNIKMFGEYNECKVDKTFTDGLQSGKEEVIAQNNWKVEKDLQEGNTYSVKSVANATGSGDVQTDEDIWKPYDATSNSSKMFLMSSEQNYQVTKEPTQTIPVNLARAAAKIALTIHVDVEGYTAGQAKWQLKNYNAKTTIFGDNAASELKDGEIVEAQGGSGEYTVTTYSYATQWTDDTKAPAIYLQVPLTADGNTEINHYKIPVRDPKATGEDAKKLNRNTIYTIDAKINNKGGSSEIEYITTGKVVYDVLPWSDGGTTDIDANTSYLMVTPKVVYMKNVDKDMSVTYKSSSPVNIVSKKVYYIDNEGNTEEYFQGYVETVYETTIEKVWVDGHWSWLGWIDGHYEDKEVKKEVQFKPYPTKMDLQNEKDGENLGGKIVINSPIPKNRFSKYIVLTLKNAEGKEATVKYKQSPLIETQNFFGDYSSRSKSGWAYRTAEGQKVKGQHTYDHSGGYLAKYYENGYIYSFRYNRTVDDLRNNRMYIIQVSSTKDSKYNIAHPNIDKSGYTNDEVVSPAFMIASQLGAVQSGSFNQTTAKTHCETYREVKKENGKQVIYDGWRLPTKTEIQFIVDFQKESYKNNKGEKKQPIKPVLEGANYYTLNNIDVATNISGANSGTFVRCVRDLTPAEVEELDKQMK